MISPGFSQRVPERVRAEEAAPPPGIQEQRAPLSRADERVEGIRSTESTSSARASEPEAPGSQTRGDTELSAGDKEEVQQLKNRDAEVRAHEQAHAATGGSHAGSPSYEFETGPDGQRYAVGGEVSIDTSEVSGDAEASISKMRQVIRAANAPAEPSGQDRKVAAQARAKMAKLQGEMTQEAARAQSPDATGEGATVDAGPNEAGKKEGAPPNAARAQRSYEQTNAAAPESSVDVTACAKCGGGH